MAMNDPKVIAKLLRALAAGSEHQASKADVIFTAAAELLEQTPEYRCTRCGWPVDTKAKPVFNGH